jgi:hypothetical protein
MPTVSQKGMLMPASPIRKLVPFAEEAKRKGRKIITLLSNFKQEGVVVYYVHL